MVHGDWERRFGEWAHGAATVALGPILAAQGARVRQTVERLPEPPGARSGSAGEGTRLRLLVVGDSSAAGVGAASQQEGLGGRVAGLLADTFHVEWRVAARSGATTAHTLRRLTKLRAAPYDVALTALGVNDVIARRSLAEWTAQQRALVRLLRERFAVQAVAVSALPPVGRFPALPQPLRWYLGRRARQFDRTLRRLVAEEEGAHYVPLDFPATAEMMASDRFHPGPPIYAAWAARAAATIRGVVADPSYQKRA